MSTIRELVFDWLFNASVQIGLFAILAAALSPFIAKAKAKYQHFFYLAIFALCLGAPVFNTLWQTRPSVVAQRSQQQPVQGAEQTDHHFWIWNGLSKAHESIILPPTAKLALLVIWEVLLLYQLIHFSRGIYRVHRLRRDAMSTRLLALESESCMPAHSYVWRHCACKYRGATQWGWEFSTVTTWRIES